MDFKELWSPWNCLQNCQHVQRRCGKPPNVPLPPTHNRSVSNPWNLWMLLYMVKDVIKLRILRGGAYSEWSSRAPNQWQVSLWETHREQRREGDSVNREADWSEAAPSPGVPTATRSWQRQESPCKASRAVPPCWHLDLNFQPPEMWDNTSLLF